MPAYLEEWSPAARTAAHTALRDLLDTGVDRARVVIYAADDTALSTIELEDPSGTIDSATGTLTLDPDGRDEEAAESGEADHATLYDGDGAPHRSLPVAEGTSPQAGKIVVTSKQIQQGEPVELVSAQVG